VLTPERVSPGLIALVGDDAPTRMVLLAGGGSFECAHITMTRGIYVGNPEDPVEALCGRMAEVQAQADQATPASAWDQPKHELEKALAKMR